MAEGLHLTEAELYEVTGFRQRDKVRTALAEMGITFKVRPADRFTLVEREHYRFIMSGGLRTKRRREPNWERANG